MRYKDFLARIEKGNISPFYLFEGEEDYLKKEALQKLKKKLIPCNEDFNFQVLNATSHKGRDILEAASQLPFNSKWYLLVVEEAEKLSSRDERMITNYLKKSVDSTCLVLMGKKFNPRSEVYNFFKKKGGLVLFYPLKQTEALDWIKDRVKEGGKAINDEAAFELYKRTGGNLFLIQSEIDKLLSFVHPENFIKKAQVIKLAGENTQENIFDFLQAFREKNLCLTLHKLNRLFLQGEKPLMVNAMLTREVRILFSLKLAEEKLTPSRACSYIFKGRARYSGFFLKKAKSYIEAAKKFAIPQLLFAQQKILNTEYSIKRGREEAEVAIQKAVIEILSL